MVLRVEAEDGALLLTFLYWEGKGNLLIQLLPHPNKTSDSNHEDRYSFMQLLRWHVHVAINLFCTVSCGVSSVPDCG